MDMEIKGLMKISSIPLAVFLLSLSGFYFFIKILRYSLTFIPPIGFVINILSAGVIIWLTINGVHNRSEKTKASVVFSAVLPLIAIVFIVLKSISFEVSIESHGLYSIYSLTEKSTIVHACVTLICSMILFFSCGRGKAIRISLGIIYCACVLFLFLMFFVAFLFSDFGENKVVRSVASPNDKYIAEIISIDQGALGGDTVVNITRQHRDINFLIGKLKKDPKRIYHGRWGEFYDMILRWETDKILYINDIKYDIK